MAEVALKDLCVSINIDNRAKGGDYAKVLRLSSYILKNPWSPLVFKEGMNGVHRNKLKKGGIGPNRHTKNFLFSDWAVLDYDDGQVTLEEAINTFCDCVHIIGTTKSHTAKQHRFRVCVPWSERITDLNKFLFNQEELVKHHDTDGQCKDAARFYFPCVQIVSINAEGFRATVKDPPKEIPKKVYKHSKTGFSSAVTFFMKNVIQVRQRNTQIYQVSKDLFRIGLDKQVVKALIIKSPTYRDLTIPVNLEREIEITMESAWRSLNG